MKNETVHAPAIYITVNRGKLRVIRDIVLGLISAKYWLEWFRLHGKLKNKFWIKNFNEMDAYTVT